jgi:hypothetical protein
LDQEKIRKRISEAEEYIRFMEIAIAAAQTEEKRTQCRTYWGFAKIVKELFEHHLTEPVSKTQEQIAQEKRKEETVDWMARWLKDQAKDLEKV